MGGWEETDMRILLVALLLAAAACSPPAATPSATEEKAAPAPSEPAAPAADLGPYTNQWDASQMSHFNHILRAATPGQHTVTLRATMTVGGTETVAVYPADANGERDGPRLMFVVATPSGTERVAQLDIPEAGLPVRVSIENLSGRQSAGAYTLTVAP
jgi:hypothetical protein